MKAKELKQFFTANDNASELETRFARQIHKGFYKCLLCGKPHQNGLRYTIGQEDAIICPACHQSFFYGKRVRNLAEMKKP